MLARTCFPWNRLLPLVLIGLAACGDDRTDGGDSETDGGTPTPDAGADADSGVDAGDARSDVGPDVTDVESDVNPGPDADAGADTDPGPDADAGPVEDADGDAVADADAEPDSAVDADVAPDVEDDTVDADAGPDPVEPSGELVDFSPYAYDESGAFDMGVQAGAMRPESFLAWTHTTTVQPLQLRVWRLVPGSSQVFMVFDGVVEPTEIGFAHVVVDGLLPGARYQYAFFTSAEADAQRSPIGQVRTALAPGSREPLTVAATSCTKASRGPFEALQAMAEQPIDLILHAGDRSYNDDAETLEEYRSFWRETLTDPGYVAFHGAAGHYSTWDDHEVTNDYDPQSINPARFEAARTTYFESLAVEPNETGGLWLSYAWGDTAEFFVLDCRSERNDDRDEYISPEQMAWLKEELANSTAHFKVVLNSVPITDMPPLYIGDGDRWEGYDGQRDELIAAITDADIPNVWFISGDFHIGMVTRIEPVGRPGRRIIEIAAGPGDNSNPAASLLDFFASSAGVDPFLFHTTSTQSEVTTLLTFDPERDEVRVVFGTADGDTLYDEWVSEGD